MPKNIELLLQMFDLQRLLNPRLIEDLDRLDQLDKIGAWYSERNPLTQLVELAEHQFKQNLESAALSQFTDAEFEAFGRCWMQLSVPEQRMLLREQAGLPKVDLISDSIY